MAFEVPGRVADVNFETGAAFERGDVLATLEDRSYSLTLAQRKAELAEARAAQQLSSTRFKRTRALRESNAVSQAQYDNDAATLASCDLSVGCSSGSFALKLMGVESFKLQE